MSLSRLLDADDPRLKEVCAPAEAGDAAIKNDLATLHQALNEFREQHGFGRAIAAPQLGIMKRMIAFNLDGFAFDMLNPVIKWHSEETQTVWDDCLSLPEILVNVERYKSISLTYQDAEGSYLSWEQLPSDHAELVQHEVDHLNGILMTERAISEQSVRPMSERDSLIPKQR